MNEQGEFSPEFEPDEAEIKKLVEIARQLIPDLSEIEIAEITGQQEITGELYANDKVVSETITTLDQALENLYTLAEKRDIDNGELTSRLEEAGFFEEN